MTVQNSERAREFRSEAGATILETALTLGIFMLVIGGGIELMRVAFYQLTYQMLASTAARCGGVTGCNITGGNNGAARAASLVDQFAAASGGLGPLAQPYGASLKRGSICIRVVGPGVPFTDCDPKYANDPAFENALEPGNTLGDPRVESERMFFVRFERPVPLFFGLGAIRVRAEAFGTTEPVAH